MGTTLLVRGTGSIGMRHLRAVRALGHVPIAVPMRAERQASLRDEGFEAAASVREAVERGATAAVIATDTARHLEDAAEALELGCDVLVEKPIAPSADGVAALRDRAARAGRRVGVAYCLRFDAGLRAFAARLPEIGAVHAVRVACQSYLPAWRPDRDYRASYSARADEGGVLRDLSHEIDYAEWLFGVPTRLSASLSTTSRLGIEAEEEADLAWRTTSGASVSVRLDYVTRRSRRALLAQGADGEIEWDAVAGTVRLSRPDQADVLATFAPDRDGMMQRQITAFLAGDDDVCSVEAARRVILTCDAARRSSASGRVEEIEP